MITFYKAIQVQHPGFIIQRTQRLVQISLPQLPSISTAMDTKIITLDELRANKSREKFYILVHGKGTASQLKCSLFKFGPSFTSL